MPDHSTPEPFPVLPWELVTRLEAHPRYAELSGADLRVLWHLIARTNSKRPKGSAFPAIRSIALATGNARSSVQLALVRLEDWGFIERAGERRSQSRHQRGVTKWTVTLPPLCLPPRARDLDLEKQKLVASLGELPSDYPTESRRRFDNVRRRFDRPEQLRHRRQVDG